MNFIECYSELLKYVGCKDYARWSELLKVVCLHEKNNSDSAFAYNKQDAANIWHRSKIVRSYHVLPWNLPKKWFCDLWLVLQELDHYNAQHPERRLQSKYWNLRNIFDYISRFFKGAMKIIDQYEITRQDFWL